MNKDEIRQEDLEEVKEAEEKDLKEELNQDDGEDEKDTVSELNEKIKELEDKNLRLLAEFNNYKKRTSEEYELNKKRTKADVFKKMVETIDGFERALNQECQDQEYVKGMQMIFDKFKNDLISLGLEEINNEGKMNHAYHQALMVEDNPDYEDDEITEVLQKGYKVDDLLVRPSMVKVNQKQTTKNEEE